MNCLDEKLDGLKLPAGLNSQISGALLHLSLEHFDAIIVLVSNRLNGSAAALIRPQYEALIRGIFFHLCASDEEASSFSEGGDPPKIKQMIERLEEKPGFTSGVLSKVHSREWRAMNSFTHGGSAQINKRFFGPDLVGSYSEEDRTIILKQSQYMAFMAASHTAIACGDLELAKQLKADNERSASKP